MMRKIVMKRMCICVLVCISFFTVVLMNSNSLATRVNSDYEMKRTYIVKVKSEKQYNIEVEKNRDAIEDGYEMLSDENIIVANLNESEVERLEKKVEYIEEDILVNASRRGDKLETRKSSKRAFNQQKQENWNMRMINAEDSYTDTIKSDAKVEDSVKIAIIDSGVDYGESIDVTQYVNLVPGEEEVSPLFADTTGHGTSVAGIIASHQNDDNSVVGINPNVDIYSVKVLDDCNQAPVSRVIEGIYYAIEQDVDIINMSFGTDNYSLALEEAVKEAADKGILVVAAAGNTGDEVQYPAAFKEVLSVGAVTSEGTISETSAVGEKVEIAAPGELIKTVGFFDGEIIASGTSMAVPHVVGVASVLWQKDRNCSAEFIHDLMCISANKYVKNGKNNCGVVDLEYALSIYDEFKKNYRDKGAKVRDTFNNNDELETVETCDLVAGSWTRTQHEELFNGQHDGNDETKLAQVIKLGATYPDKNDQCDAMSDNPWWHGYYRQTDEKSREICKNNYFAAFNYISKIAIKGDIASSKGVDGLTEQVKDNIDNDVASINWDVILEKTCDFDNQSEKNKQKYKKAFLWGMLLHSTTDLFAHCTAQFDSYTGNYEWISHPYGADNTDDTDDSKGYKKEAINYGNRITYKVYSKGAKRLEAAKKVADEVLKCMNEKRKVGVDEIAVADAQFNGEFYLLYAYEYASIAKPNMSDNTRRVIGNADYSYTRTERLKSLIFNAEFYYNAYPDLARAYGYNEELLRNHYINCGIREGRMPSMFFDPKWYVENNSDIKAICTIHDGNTTRLDYTNAYNHFVTSGFWEGRCGSLVFDQRNYLERYNDLQNVYHMDTCGGLEHFINYGMKEFRVASRVFDINAYRNYNPDVVQAYGRENAFGLYFHYSIYGRKENRRCQ